jgi:FAD/FMN-containing dehydrogenase
MARLNVKTLTGNQVPLEESTIESLRSSLRGELILLGDAVYDEARRVWNGMIDKRPALIVRCAGTEDVIASVNFARDNALLLAVRGGGHNVAGYAVCDGGLVIDLSQMRAVQVDPEARRARAQGGALWGELDRAAQPYALATPGGEVSVTGIAGLTLGGGVGYLRRKYGLSCDNVTSMEVVTADGQLRRASPAEHPDLYWALRGGGGNFGAVTSFEFRLHPVGPTVATLSAMYPLRETRRLLSAWQGFAATAPDEATTAFAIWEVPSHPDIPTDLYGTPVCMFDGMYAGALDAGEALFRPLRELGAPVLDMSARAPYVEVQSSFDDFMPDGDLYYWKSLYLDELSDEAIEAIVSWGERRPNSRILVILRHLGGAINRVDQQATAYGNRSAEYMLSIDGAWTDPQETEANIAWIRAFWDDMQRFSNGGVYLNFPGFGEGETLLWRASYGTNYDRLAAVKAKYDPNNLFRVNQNIKPES